MLTFVFTICNRRGDADGLSPAPTTATRDVQNNISTIDVAPSSTKSQNRQLSILVRLLRKSANCTDSLNRSCQRDRS
jgi:hypothetical protein